jgi:hypothetical protein
MELVYWGGSPIDLPFVWHLPDKGYIPCIHWYHSPIAPVPTGWFTRLLRAVHPPCGQPLETGRRSAHTPACGSVVGSLEAQPKGHLCRSTVKNRHMGFKWQESGSRGSWSGWMADFALWVCLKPCSEKPVLIAFAASVVFAVIAVIGSHQSFRVRYIRSALKLRRA